MGLPLAGYRVLDFGQYIAGPVAAAILGDQGADVIKIETPTGDVMRGAGPARGGLGIPYLHWNRNKRSISIDLRNGEGRGVIERLIETADVLIHNYRPGVPERLGLSEDQVRAINPRIVYVAISGWGHEGPLSRETAYDGLVQAMSGQGWSQSEGGAITPYLIRTPMIDKLTGMTTAQAASAALAARERTGEGQLVRLSMFDIAVEFGWTDIFGRDAFLGEDCPQTETTDRGDWIQPTADGLMVCQTVSDEEFRKVARLTGNDHWIEDDRFNSTGTRTKNMREYCKMLKHAFVDHPTDYWIAKMRAENIGCAPVLSPDQIVRHEQLHANRTLHEQDHPRAGRYQACQGAARFNNAPARFAYHAPDLGEHTDEILAELSLSGEDVAGLRQRGVVR